MFASFKLRHLAVLFLCVGAASAGSVRADPQDAISQKTINEIKAIEAAKAALTPAEAKVSFDLLSAIRASLHQPVIKGVPSVRASAIRMDGNKAWVLVNARVSEDIASFVKSHGGVILAESPRYGLISAAMPLDKILELAERSDVTSIEPAPLGVDQQVSPPAVPILQNAQGDLAHAGAAARTRFNVKGAGVKVCVISGGVVGIEKAEENGSVGHVDYLSGQRGPNNDSEGAAMLEIVHRIAPLAALEFATSRNSEGYGDEVVMADNIEALSTTEKCNIIVDDVLFDQQDPFQPGAISDAVRQASDNGVLYFTSAGNYGNKLDGRASTWEGEFRSDGTTHTKMGKTGELLNFLPPSSPYSFAQDALLSLGHDREVDLFWNDPIGANATNVYDLFAENDAGDVVYTGFRSALSPNVPFEEILIDEHYDFVGAGLKLIVLKPTASQVRFLHIDAYKSDLFLSTNGSIRGHNASGAANAFTVAAIDAEHRTGPFQKYSSANKVENYSSDGPRRVFYDFDGTAITQNNLTATGGRVLRKPDLTAADCVSTDLAGFKKFCGTSAATPNAAAIAALVWSYKRALTPDQVRLALEGSTIRIGAASWSDTSGYGIVMADAALEVAASIRLDDHQPQGSNILQTAYPYPWGWVGPGLRAKTTLTKDHKVLTYFTWPANHKGPGITPDYLDPSAPKKLTDPIDVGMIGLDTVVLNRDGSIVRFSGLDLLREYMDSCHTGC
jgi:subtilisin family serine protease